MARRGGMRDLFTPAVMAGAVGLWLTETSPGGLGGFAGFWLGFFGYLILRIEIARVVRDELAHRRGR